MRILRNILIGLVVLIAALAAGAYLLPRNVIVEREITIDAAPADVYAHVQSLQAFTEWSPWQDRDPNMTVNFSGPEAGVGNVMEWQSDVPEVGNGRQEIIAVSENAEVRTALDFGSMGTAEAWWLLADADGATTVTWGLDADMGNTPMGRWFGLMMDDLVGGDYDAGLLNLKTLVEG